MKMTVQKMMRLRMKTKRSPECLMTQRKRLTELVKPVMVLSKWMQINLDLVYIRNFFSEIKVPNCGFAEWVNDVNCI